MKRYPALPPEFLDELLDCSLEDNEFGPSGDVPFQISLESEDACVDLIVDEILRVVPIVTRKMNVLRRNVRIVILNLLAANTRFDSRSIRYSRSEGAYRKSRYNTYGASYSSILAIIDKMSDCGFLTHSLGHRSTREVFSSKMSAFRATKKLRDLLDLCTEKVSIKEGESEIIVLRDSGKRLVDYEETLHTGQMRRSLRALNSFIASKDIKVPAGYEHLQSRKSYCRIFNNSTFRHGGRFYGGFWTMVPRESRKDITIEGSPVCELDYGSQSLTIAYALEGVAPPSGDLYAITGYAEPHMRAVVKRAVTVALGSKSRGSALRALRWKDGLQGIVKDAEEAGIFSASQIEEIRNVDVNSLLDAIEHYHEGIGSYFYIGHAHILQRLDSELALSVMECAKSLGVVSLSLHDGFVVKEENREVMMQIMHTQFQAMFGIDPIIK